MRIHRIILASLLLAACGAAPIKPTAPIARPNPAAEVLLTTAANEFHTHAPKDPVGFRDVRLGHRSNEDGGARYVLCGEFLPTHDPGKANWVHFATLQTSGYEQWIGGQALGHCTDPGIQWDDAGDLSASLQSRVDSLR